MHSTDSDELRNDKSPCGVYRVPAGYLQCCQSQPDQANLQWYFFPSLDVVVRESLLNALSETLHFPDYFGHNWDAAWDCLSEQVWSDNKRQIIHLRIDADTFLAESDLHTFVELMDDACTCWASNNTACLVLIETDRRDSQTLNQLRSL